MLRRVIERWPPGYWTRVTASCLGVADELWPSSGFTAAVLCETATAAGLPLQVMPMAAEVEDSGRFCTASRSAGRARAPLPVGGCGAVWLWL